MKNLDTQSKIILALLSAILAMGSWFVREQTKELREIRLVIIDVERRLGKTEVGLEVSLGGNPFSHEDEGESE